MFRPAWSRSWRNSSRAGPISGREPATHLATPAALGAILLWGTLATFGVALAHLPPLFLTGCALTIGALPGVARLRQWRVRATTLLLGSGGLFGFHFLLFLALRNAPPVEANLVNYLWPLLIVLLTPVIVTLW